MPPLLFLFWIWWRREKSLSLTRLEPPAVQSIASNFLDRATVPQIHEIKKNAKSTSPAFRTVPAVKPVVLRKTWCLALHLCWTLLVIVLSTVYLERLLPQFSRLATVLSCVHVCLISASWEASSCVVSQEIAYTLWNTQFSCVHSTSTSVPVRTSAVSVLANVANEIGVHLTRASLRACEGKRKAMLSMCILWCIWGSGGTAPPRS